MKTVYIMQGLPGSGKSTKAQELGGTIVSADDFFIREGEYKYDQRLAGLSHNWCFKLFESALKSGDPVVVVDNTNTTAKEFTKYVDTADRYGYFVEFVRMPKITVEEALERNTHNVPRATIETMYHNLYE